jgi:hypothetical protein
VISQLSEIVNFLTATKSGRHSISERLQQDIGIGSPNQLSNSILATMVASVELSEGLILCLIKALILTDTSLKALTHMVDLLLEDTNIQKVLAEGKMDESVLKGYISEVLRKL